MVIDEPIAFTKWEGLGNDFVFICGLEQVLPCARELAIKMCDRHFGIGADGLIFLLNTAEGLSMDIYNADGSRAKMCGNGIRCLAAMAVLENLVEEASFPVNTLSGVKQVTVMPKPDEMQAEQRQFLVEVDMGLPIVYKPQTCTWEDGRSFPEVLVNMGNLHRVILTGEQVAPEALAQELELNAPGLANSDQGLANVELVRIIKGLEGAVDELQVEVSEAGVGRTLACGTGACASFAAACYLEHCREQAIVHLPGGDLQLAFNEEGHILMTGPARLVYSGIWCPLSGSANNR